MANQQPDWSLCEELTLLRQRVSEYEDLLRALRTGEVDALFVSEGADCRALPLGDAESSYRALVEAMSEGAAVIQRDGTLLYCNGRLAAMLELPIEVVMGASILDFVTSSARANAARLLTAGHRRRFSAEVGMTRQNGDFVPVQWSISPLKIGQQVGVCLVATDLTERYRVQEELRSLSLHDELTGLFNRRGFITHAEQQLKLARRIEGQLLIVFADLDGLKSINDQLGHQAGDQAISEAAEVLRRSFRESDIIARLGGDEFAVLATGTEGNAAEVIRQRVQHHVDEHNARSESAFLLAMSVGIIPYDPRQPAPVVDLLTQADAAMYENKRDRRRAGNRPPLPEIAIDVRSASPAAAAVEPGETPNIGVWEWTRETGCVQWSPEISEVLGISESDGTLQALLAHVHADDRSRVVSAARLALASRHALSAQFRVCTPDGKLRLVSSRAHGEYSADGKALRLLGTLTDVTAYIAASELTQVTLDSIPANICVLDGETRILSINRGWREYGKANGEPDPERHIGRSYLDICAQDSGPQSEFSQQLAAGISCVLTGDAKQFDLDYPCHSEQAQRWFNASVRRLDTVSGTRLLVRHQEITQAVIVEDCLSRTLHPGEPASRARDGIFIVQDDCLVFANHAFSVLLGREDESFTGVRFVDLLKTAEARQWFNRLSTRSARRLRRSEARFGLVKPQGDVLTVTATVMPTTYNSRPALLGTLHPAG